MDIMTTILLLFLVTFLMGMVAGALLRDYQVRGLDLTPGEPGNEPAAIHLKGPGEDSAKADPDKKGGD